MLCVQRTPMLLLPLLYECSVTTVLLSGANERRRIGPSLTPSPRTIGKKVKFSHTRYRALGPELIPVYRQSARR